MDISLLQTAQELWGGGEAGLHETLRVIRMQFLRPDYPYSSDHLGNATFHLHWMIFQSDKKSASRNTAESIRTPAGEGRCSVGSHFRCGKSGGRAGQPGRARGSVRSSPRAPCGRWKPSMGRLASHPQAPPTLDFQRLAQQTSTSSRRDRLLPSLSSMRTLLQCHVNANKFNMKPLTRFLLKLGFS